MTTADDSPQLAESAADDVLLLLARVESPDVPLPRADDVNALLLQHMDEATARMARFGGRNNGARQRDLMFGADAVIQALHPVAMAHLLLSIRLLAWSAKRTGLSHAEVVAEVLAHTDVEEGA